MKILTTPNTFAARYRPSFGIAQIKPAPGDTFDVNNDLTLSACGTRVFHRDGFVSETVADCFVDYDKRNLTARAFVECYGDSDIEEEFGMLHGV